MLNRFNFRYNSDYFYDIYIPDFFTNYYNLTENKLNNLLLDYLIINYNFGDIYFIYLLSKVDFTSTNFLNIKYFYSFEYYPLLKTDYFYINNFYSRLFFDKIPYELRDYILSLSIVSTNFLYE